MIWRARTVLCWAVCYSCVSLSFAGQYETLKAEYNELKRNYEELAEKLEVQEERWRKLSQILGRLPTDLGIPEVEGQHVTTTEATDVHVTESTSLPIQLEETLKPETFKLTYEENGKLTYTLDYTCPSQPASFWRSRRDYTTEDPGMKQSVLHTFSRNDKRGKEIFEKFDVTPHEEKGEYVYIQHKERSFYLSFNSKPQNQPKTHILTSDLRSNVKPRMSYANQGEIIVINATYTNITGYRMSSLHMMILWAKESSNPVEFTASFLGYPFDDKFERVKSPKFSSSEGKISFAIDTRGENVNGIWSLMLDFTAEDENNVVQAVMQGFEFKIFDQSTTGPFAGLRGFLKLNEAPVRCRYGGPCQIECAQYVDDEIEFAEVVLFKEDEDGPREISYMPYKIFLAYSLTSVFDLTPFSAGDEGTYFCQLKHNDEKVRYYVEVVLEPGT